MEIREITGDKRRYLPLLLVGDEQEEMVMRYLPHGSLFVCFDPDPCAVAVVTDEGDGCCELKNLAVEPCRQRQGYGRRMVAFVVRRYTARGYRTLRVGRNALDAQLLCTVRLPPRRPHPRLFYPQLRPPDRRGGRPAARHDPARTTARHRIEFHNPESA